MYNIVNYFRVLYHVHTLVRSKFQFTVTIQRK